jgi:hypothetical protein
MGKVVDFHLAPVHTQLPLLPEPGTGALTEPCRPHGERRNGWPFRQFPHKIPLP